MQSQNSDGGWGYRPASQSATEPTAWTLCALHNENLGEPSRKQISLGKDWLLRNQLADGSWPSFALQTEGCWVTALAGLALHEIAGESDAVTRGFDWLCNSWPRTPNFWQRLRQRLSSSGEVTRQNNSLAGWAWTTNTGSWVEPTSYALIFLRRLDPKHLSTLALKRKELAQAMLCDRMCPGGGWNSGNPLVYGVAGEPLVGPTVWALLALRECGELPQVRESLQWLEKSIPQIHGSVSTAIAHMCLKVYGRRIPAIDLHLQERFETDRFLNNISVTALAALDLNPARSLFPPAAQEVAAL
ncbi:MAG: hypothetical protein WA734_12830 [Candidatus Acidiferrales bacterium]